MKKVILVAAMVFATSSLINANTTTVEKEIIEIEDASCIGIVNNQLEAIERETGQRMTFEQWSKAFNILFRACEDA